MSYSQPPMVPGQFTSGVIDGFSRDPSTDGTLGNPDFSPLPYSYTAMLEPTTGQPQWTFGSTSASSGTLWGAFKGSPDGFGVLRDTGNNDASTLFRYTADSSPGIVIGPRYGVGASAAQLWSKKDFVVAVRSAGGSSSPSCYLGFRSSGVARFFRALPTTSVGPWDVEPCDQPSYSLSGKVDLWDGAPHDIIVTQVGLSVMALIDYKVPVLFPSPGTWHYVGTGLPGGGVPTGSRYALPNTPGLGYMGIDSRSTSATLSTWTALPSASADTFLWQPAYGPQDPPSAASYTPAAMTSNQNWTISGTATGSANGVLLASSSSMWCTPFRSSGGWISARFGSVAPLGGLVFRRLNDFNYLVLTQSGALNAVIGGTANTLFTLPSSIPTDAEVVLRYNATTAAIVVNYGAIAVGDMANLKTGIDISGQITNGTDVGFVNPPGSTSQFRYLYHQPEYTVPVLPTT